MLEQKFELYKELSASCMDAFGFILTEHCDALMFSALIGCVPDIEVDVLAACDSSGMWHRRPIGQPCWPEHSKSTISRDMFVGLAWYCWINKRLDISEQIIKYALKHFGFMGKGTGLVGLSRINIMPPLLATFAWISYRLGGPSRAWLRWIPADFGLATPGDFQAHLQVLHCLLRRKLTGREQQYRAIFRAQRRRQPRNPLFAYAAGEIDQAFQVLADTSLWPHSGLPSRGHRKSPWLPERDYGPDWLPTGEDSSKLHSGGDFLFVYSLCVGLI